MVGLYAALWGVGWWWHRRQVNRVGAVALAFVASERNMAWAKLGLTYEFGVRRRSTGDPASWLRLRGPQSEAVLTVWLSGDARLDWEIATDTHSRQFSLSSGTDPRRCVDELEAVVRRSP